MASNGGDVEKSAEVDTSSHSRRVESKVEAERPAQPKIAEYPQLLKKESIPQRPHSAADVDQTQLLLNPEQYVVEFDGPEDPMRAINWPLPKKIYTALILAYTTLVVTFGSAIFSAATKQIAIHFSVSTEVSLLGLTLYVLGFSTGPIFWAPLSEMQGRRLPLVVAMFGFSLFQIAVATGKDLQTVLICRFWGGFFGACPLTLVGATFSDIVDKRLRGLIMSLYSATVFIGPLLAPFIGGFIVQNPHLGWRWTEYLTGIMGWLAFVLNLFFLDEAYAPVILKRKAAHLRQQTHNWAYHSKMEEEAAPDLRSLVSKNFGRPIQMLFSEPIALFFAVYLAFVYGILYLFLTTYPVVFQEIRGWSPGVGGLPYLGIICGQLLGVVALFAFQPWYNKKLSGNGGVVVPEWRLPPVIVAGVLFAAGLFWFGWTGEDKSVHWIVPTLSGLLTGFGLLVIFVQSINYLIDVYLVYAASAVAANTMLRSPAGACFPLFSEYLFRRLGVGWSLSLLGFIALVLVPFPIVLLFHGPKIRSKSKFAPTART